MASPLANRAVEGDSRPPVTYLSFWEMGLPTNPAQYKSAAVGVCTRSTGKLMDVRSVPAGTGAFDPDCASNAIGANSNTLSTAFLMVPPPGVDFAGHDAKLL